MLELNACRNARVHSVISTLTIISISPLQNRPFCWQHFGSPTLPGGVLNFFIFGFSLQSCAAAPNRKICFLCAMQFGPAVSSSNTHSCSITYFVRYTRLRFCLILRNVFVRFDCRRQYRLLTLLYFVYCLTFFNFTKSVHKLQMTVVLPLREFIPVHDTK